jgi:broad specificity phosphatase PhoE
MGRIVLLRHSEALKNIEHRHGGSGTSLTHRGCAQAQEFARLAKVYFPDLECVHYVAKPQCHETASIVVSEQNLPVAEIEGLLPFNLGVLDGLSDEEVRKQHPKYSRMIEDWRLGLIDISEVRILGATDMKRFYDHGTVVLTRLLAEDNSIVVVGTRSVLVLFWNILKNHSPDQGGLYYERPWDNCEWVEFVSNEKCSWNSVREQRHKG